MSTQLVNIAGEQSNLILRATNITGVALDIISGSFRPSPEERRVCSVFFGIGAKTLEIRLEFTDFVFPIRDFKGNLTSRSSESEARV